MALSPDAKIETTTLLILMTAQAFCAVFFVGDAIVDFGEAGRASESVLHMYIEATAAAALVAAIVLEARWLLALLRRKAHLERSLATAQAAIHDVVEAHFDAWKLTPSERDVAAFLVKGLSTAEIADVRGRAEGTIKAHLNAIYRKAGARNRAELLSGIIDGMMAEDAATAAEADQEEASTGRALQ